MSHYKRGGKAERKLMPMPVCSPVLRKAEECFQRPGSGLRVGKKGRIWRKKRRRRGRGGGGGRGGGEGGGEEDKVEEEERRKGTQRSSRRRTRRRGRE